MNKLIDQIAEKIAQKVAALLFEWLKGNLADLVVEKLVERLRREAPLKGIDLVERLRREAPPKGIDPFKILKP